MEVLKEGNSASELLTSALYGTSGFLIFDQSPFATPLVSGGPDASRTRDLLLARQVLSQLSYGPIERNLFMY